MRSRLNSHLDCEVVVVQKDVVALQVAMNDVLCVQITEKMRKCLFQLNNKLLVANLG